MKTIITTKMELPEASQRLENLKYYLQTLNKGAK